MSRPRRLMQCRCGCGKMFNTSDMTAVLIEQALDHQARQTKTTRVIVSRKCQEAYEMELGLMKVLHGYVQRWTHKPKTPLQRLNLVATFRDWLKRIGAAVEVMKTQHAIYERTKGFEWARQHAVESAVLFGCPRFMQEFMARRFLARAQRKKFKDATATPVALDAVKA